MMRGRGGWRGRRLAPVGYQHGRRASAIRRAPFLYWSYYFLFAHITLRLCIVSVVVLLPAVFLMWSGFGETSLPIGFATLSVILVSFVAGLINLPRKLHVTCEIPRRVERGTDFVIRYRVTNRGRMPARDVVLESLIFSDYFQYRLRRPGLQWLAAGESATVEGGGVALGRGVFTLPALRWDTAFPFGFWRWGRTARSERILYIYPGYRPLRRLDLPLGPRRQEELPASAEPTREALEFAGCREYRVGDAMRHVHARSSARLGIPVVKEFQTTGFSRAAVMLDTYKPERGWRDLSLRLRKVDVFEAALSLATAIIEALSRSSATLELLVAGDRTHRFAAGGANSYFEEVLDILAALEPQRDDPFREPDAELFAEIGEIHSLCLILTGWDETRRGLVDFLRASGAGLKVVLVTDGGEVAAELPYDVECVDARALARGEVNEV